MSRWGNTIPARYSDDGCINPDYVAWQEWQDYEPTYYEEQWEAERDLQIIVECECEEV